MRRWNPRRARRQDGPQLAADLPLETPDDVRGLARSACREAGRLLAGLDPDAVGLVLVHPRSCACHEPQARAGRVLFRVEPHDDLLALAHRLNLTAQPRPGWFCCLLVSIEASGLPCLAPASRLDFERRVS
jgi:hypothetical protein